MNILLIKNVVVWLMVSEISIVSVFGYFLLHGIQNKYSV